MPKRYYLGMCTVALIDHFRENIAAAMRRNRITHRELADSLGMHRVTVTRILTGAATPSIDTCERMAAAVGERPDTIFLAPPLTTVDKV